MKTNLSFIIVLALVGCSFIQCRTYSDSFEYNLNDPTVAHVDSAEITCPHCGFKKVETLPTEVCQIRYTCEACTAELTPLGDDCCVFCSYGDHKCPSKQ